MNRDNMMVQNYDQFSLQSISYNSSQVYPSESLRGSDNNVVFYSPKHAKQQSSRHHTRFPSIDSDQLLQRIAASCPGKSFGTQIEYQEEEKSYSYIQVESTSPLAKIPPESLSMLEAICRQPQLLKQIAHNLTDNSAGYISNMPGTASNKSQMPIPEGFHRPPIQPSLPSYQDCNQDLTQGFKPPMVKNVSSRSLMMSESGSSKTESTGMSSETEVRMEDFVDMFGSSGGYQEGTTFQNSQEGSIDPRSVADVVRRISSGNSISYSTPVQEAQPTCSGCTLENGDTQNRLTNGGKVRRVKSNGPQDNASRRGLPRYIVKRLSWWLCQHATDPYPTKSEKVELANALCIDKTQVSNWFVNARTRFWKPIVINIFESNRERLQESAYLSGNETVISQLEELAACDGTNLNAPNLVALFDRKAINQLEETVLLSFQTGFNDA